MATLNVYNVDYHFEVAGKKVGADYYASVGAAANDYNTIRGVLSTNNLLNIPGTLVIDNVQADPSGNQTILT